jgi:hypothetical protein
VSESSIAQLALAFILAVCFNAPQSCENQEWHPDPRARKCIAELTVRKMAGLSTELDILEPLNSGPSVVNSFLTNLPNELVA